MTRLMKLSFYAAVLIGVALISINGYIWHQTGEWGQVGLMDLLYCLTGRKIELPHPDPQSLHKWIAS